MSKGGRPALSRIQLTPRPTCRWRIRRISRRRFPGNSNSDSATRIVTTPWPGRTIHGETREEEHRAQRILEETTGGPSRRVPTQPAIGIRLSPHEVVGPHFGDQNRNGNQAAHEQEERQTEQPCQDALIRLAPLKELRAPLTKICHRSLFYFGRVPTDETACAPGT